MKDMKKRNDLRPLTKAEMEVMNVLWDATEALTIHEIIERYQSLVLHTLPLPPS